MTIRRAACALLVLAVPLALAAGCRGGSDEARLERGGQAYLAQCAVCHGIHGEGDGPLAVSIAAEGKTAPAVLGPARVDSLGPAALRHAIESGAHRRPGSPMPLWGFHLGPEWTDRITEYVAVIIYDHLTQVDTNAELDLPVPGNPRCPAAHFLL